LHCARSAEGLIPKDNAGGGQAHHGPMNDLIKFGTGKGGIVVLQASGNQNRSIIEQRCCLVPTSRIQVSGRVEGPGGGLIQLSTSKVVVAVEAAGNQNRSIAEESR
jgi:hypothetical protein